MERRQRATEEEMTLKVSKKLKIRKVARKKQTNKEMTWKECLKIIIIL